MNVYLLISPEGLIHSSARSNAAPEAPPGFAYHVAPDGYDDADREAWRFSEAGFSKDIDGLDHIKDAHIARVKAEATRRIDALAWRIERASERDTLGLPGESINDVLAEREAIRRASNRTEADILAAPDRASIESIESLDLIVTEADLVRSMSLTHKQFMDRFTDAELTSILAAVDAAPAMKTWWVRFEKAGAVVLTDPLTAVGVHALELAGLLAAGRQNEILS